MLRGRRGGRSATARRLTTGGTCAASRGRGWRARPGGDAAGRRAVSTRTRPRGRAGAARAYGCARESARDAHRSVHVVRGRCQRLDGRAAAHGGGQRRGAVAADGRVSAARRSRVDRVSRRARGAVAGAHQERASWRRRVCGVCRLAGRTPLAAALRLAQSTLASLARRRGAARSSLVVLVSDGRANVAPMDGDAHAEALAAAPRLRASGVAALVVDSEDGPVRFGLARSVVRAAARAVCAPGGSPRG